MRRRCYRRRAWPRDGEPGRRGAERRHGPGSSFQTIRELCPQSTILQGFVIRGGSERDGQYLVIKDERAEEATKEVESWLRKIGILK